MKRVLESSGEFLVDTCSSGQFALERLLDEDFDLVITDLKMPGMSGMEVIQTLKSIYPDVPVVMITGYANVATAVEAMKYGAANYIPKPFKPQELIDNIRAALQTGKESWRRSFPEARACRLRRIRHVYRHQPGDVQGVPADQAGCPD